ncbi:MAG: HAD-IA family hydrolase [Methylovulum sp.]|nr:HAD-IA family hydrolase [Methylovulum sp.]
MATDFKLTCVLFDLDGTLVDTAPDLLACLDKALNHHGYAAALPETVKPLISYGAAAMIKKNLADSASAACQAEILDTMLDYYQHNIAEHSVFFDGIPEILTSIEAQGLKWGVVTNKRQRFTEPLMAALKLTDRAACIISGDTTSNPKPHVAPMLAACHQAGVAPQQCVYIGDANHDITAGNNAQMKTLVALYGYLKPTDTPETWGADALIASPAQLSTWISSVLCP